MLSRLMASVLIMLFETGEAYSNTDLTNVTYNNNQMSMVKKGVRQLAYKFKRLE